MNTIKSNLINLLVNLPGIEEPNSRPAYIEDLVAPDIRPKIDWQGSIYDFVSNFVKFLAKHRKYLLGFLDELANSDRFGIERPPVARQLRQEIASLSPQEWFWVFGVSDWTEWGALPDCPYRGLQAFQPEHKDLFFGRQKFVDRLVKEVDVKQLVAVIGASGSGKSSVVFAGLIPQLPENWEVVSFRPGKRPFEALAGVLLRRLYHLPTGEEVRELAGGLREGKVALGNISSTSHSQTTLLVADQFEELYTLCSEWETRERFLDCLLEAADNAPGFKLVLTMRADFYHYALGYRPFADALQNACVNLGPMNGEELQEAISRPAESRGVSLEVGLVERILQDIGKKPDEVGNNSKSKQPPDKLPLLEFALKQLWEAATENGYPELTNKAYTAIGGVELALGKHAEKVYEELLQGKQDREKYELKQIQQVFIQLVQPGENTGTDDTRRLATRGEIGEENWDLVLRLNREEVRLVVVGRDEVRDTEKVEVVHEVLISGWSRLTGWMNANREFRVWQERLRAELREWKEKDKDKGVLLRGRRLVEAEGWLSEREEDISLPEQEFIWESVGLRERKRRRTISLLTGGLLVALGLAGFAAFGWLNTFISAENTDFRLRRANLEKEFTANQLEGVVEAIKLGKQLQKSKWARLDTRTSVEATLRQIVYEVKESNQLEGHRASVWRVVFSPDGELIASASDDSTVKLWKRDGSLLHTLKGHTAEVRGLVFSPDGELIASASVDNTVKLWKPDGSLLHTLKGHSALVYDVVFSPDGDLIASASNDSTVKLWKRDGSLLHTLKGHTARVRGVAFSPDGELIASASVDNTVKLWKRDGGLLHTLTEHTAPVIRVAFSPDGELIASASADNTVKLWKPDGGLLHTLTEHTAPVIRVAFSPDGELIASASADNTVKLWKPDGSLLHTLRGHSALVGGIVFSSNGKLITSASDDGTVKLWKLDGSLLKTLAGHGTGVSSVVFSPDGELIASASGDNTIKLWKLDSNWQPTLTGHKAGVYSLVFSPNGELIASASADNTVKLWKPDGSLLHTLTGHEAGVWRVVFSPNGELIASASADNTVKLWKPDGSLLNTLTGHTAPVGRLVVSPDGELIVSSGVDKLVKLWKRDGSLLHTLTGHNNSVYSVVFSPDGELIASASDDSTVKLWKRDGSLLQTLTGHNAAVRKVIFSPNDGQLIASASNDNTVKLWKRDGSLLHTMTHVRGVVFSPDGELIASASNNNTVKVWKPDGSLLSALKGHSASVTRIVFSPNGELIASASADNTIKLWKRDGSLLHTLTGHSAAIQKVVFSPDGHLIASASNDGIIKLWNLDLLALDKVLSLSCNWVHDYLKNNSNVSEEERRLCGVEASDSPENKPK